MPADPSQQTTFRRCAGCPHPGVCKLFCARDSEAGELDWLDIWRAMQELGAALRPLMEQPAPPSWAISLSHVMDLAEPRVLEACPEEVDA